MAKEMEEKDWQSFLSSGFFLRWSDSEWLVGHTEGLPSTKYKGTGQLYTPDFFLEEPNNWRQFAHVLRVPHAEMAGRFPKTRARMGLIWDEPSREEFDCQYFPIQSQLDNHKLEKAVPVVFAKTRTEVKPEVREMILRHLVHHEGMYAYGFWMSQTGVMGITPEILFDMSGQEIETMALAGTGPKGGPSLLDDTKQVHEHQFVVKDITEKLHELGSFTTGRTQDHDLVHLRHLLTPIRVHLDEPMDGQKIVKLLHPTPALGVAPAEFNWKWLKKLCSHRSRFGAPFGYFDFEGRCRVLVGIRNIEWAGSEIRLGSGCGVVAQSQPDKEWEELAMKRDSVKSLLGL